MLVARDLHKSYGAVEVVRGIDLALESGQVLGVLGPNGAGKSTTVGMLYGMVIPSKGFGQINGIDIHGRGAEARRLGVRRVGALYRRTRPDGQGGRAQRAAARFDQAGCLRTPAGGSSRQTLLIAEPDGRLRARLLSAREAARLMGAPDALPLPERYSDAYRLAGDGVAVPVARFVAAALARPILEPAPAPPTEPQAAEPQAAEPDAAEPDAAA